MKLFDYVSKLMNEDKCDIIYANGNDGTEFDWTCNNRMCEFIAPGKCVYINSDKSAELWEKRNGVWDERIVEDLPSDIDLWETVVTLIRAEEKYVFENFDVSLDKLEKEILVC